MLQNSPTASPSFSAKVKPRIYTPPLVQGPPGPCGCGCALTKETSLGFKAVQFAKQILGVQLLPWQRWVLIHALELNADGTYRFKTIMVLVARQNGKSFLLKVLALFRLYMDGAKLVLGTAQTLQMAKEAWGGACDLAFEVPELRVRTERKFTGIGIEALLLKNGARYKVAAANESAGRGLSVDLLILDEIAQHRSPAVWAALSKTTMARPKGQNFAITTPGDLSAVIANQLQDQGRAAADNPNYKGSLGLFEYSAPDDCDIDDLDGIAQANPAIGFTIDNRSIQSALETDPPAIFRTEVLCQRLISMDQAINMTAWVNNRDPYSNMNNLKSRLVACFDISTSNRHASLLVAAMSGPPSAKQVKIEVRAEWSGRHCTTEARADLPRILDSLKPRAIGWFPNGPAAALMADLKNLRNAQELKAGEVNAVCMGFAEQVAAGRVIHNGDRMLHTQAEHAEKLRSGDGWRFVRPKDDDFNSYDVDGIYAAAGAVHLARTLPDYGKPRIILPDEE